MEASAISLRCHCSRICESGILSPARELPLNIEICHCDQCRYTSGSLGVSSPQIDHAPSAKSRANLTRYRSTDILTRHFCSNCGCHMFLEHHLPRTQWYCLNGVIEDEIPEISQANLKLRQVIRINKHQFVSDTVDGGLVPCMLELGGRTIAAWSGAAPDNQINARPHDQDSVELRASDLSLMLERPSTQHSRRSDSLLSARCHCGGVSLLIKPASYGSTSASSRFIPKDPTKYMAYLCACRSCRLTTGTSLVPFVLIPPAQILNGHADPHSGIVFGPKAIDPSANPGQSLKHYQSSPDTWRSFCSRCGATIFYFCEKRPDELDLAVGILRAPEGSMARSWLAWDWGRCSFAEECREQELLAAWKASAATSGHAVAGS